MITPHLFQKQIWSNISKKRNSSRIKQGQNPEPKPQQVSACMQLTPLHTFNSAICSAGRALQPSLALTSPVPSLPTSEDPLLPSPLQPLIVPIKTHHCRKAFQTYLTKPALNFTPYIHAGSTLLSDFSTETEHLNYCLQPHILSRQPEKKVASQPPRPYPWWSHHTRSGKVPPGCTAAGCWGHQRGSCCAGESHPRSAACPQFSRILLWKKSKAILFFMYIYLFIFR